MTQSKNNWQPVASWEIVKQRARMLKRIRAFFDARDILEVETPIIASAGTTDPHIDSLHTEFSRQSFYLNTSPEYAMKRLLALQQEAVYQVCKVFRDGELGPRHNPEFTMLEWYRPDFDIFQLMDEVQALLAHVLEGSSIKIERMSYREAFEQFAGIDPHVASAAGCRDCAIKHGIEQPVGLEDDRDEWLDWLLTQLVAPSFAEQGFTFIYNYPASQAALARLRNDEVGVEVASRFELFFGDLELANGFHELQNSEEQRRRFEQENQHRSISGKPMVRIDEHLLAALDSGLPDCSGVALGLDRLLMVISESKKIDEVLSFPFAIV